MIAALSPEGIPLGIVTEVPKLPMIADTRALASALGTPPEVKASLTELLS